MHRLSPKLEQRILVCCLETRSKRICDYILASTTVEDFGVEYAAEVRTRMDTLIELDKGLGRCVDMKDDPALSKKSSRFILASPRVRKLARKIKMRDLKKMVQTLRDHRRVRSAYYGLKTATEILKGKAGEKEFDKFCTTLEKTLTNVRQEYDEQPLFHFGKGQSQKDVKAVTRELLQSTNTTHISTGMEALDKHLNGHARGQLVVISAPRKGGKSAMAMNLAVNQYLKQDLSVLYVSLEMSKSELIQRVVAKTKSIPYTVTRVPELMSKVQRAKFIQATKDLYQHGKRKNCRFTIWDAKSSSLTPQVLESSVRGLKYDVIYVDYLTLLSRSKIDLWEMQLEYSRIFKQMAKRLNCVIVLLTQLNTSDAVKYGQGVEENLDSWLKWPWREDEEEETGDVTVSLALCRHAPSAKFPAKFNLNYMQIELYPAETYVKTKKGENGSENQKKGGRRKEKMEVDDERWKLGAF
jgi:KaiC/GvpD/RAD55 family RecA-like ATPase